MPLTRIAIAIAVVSIVSIWVAALVVGIVPALSLLSALAALAAVSGFHRPSVGLVGVGMLCTLSTLTRSYLMSGGLLRWNTLNYWLFAVMVIAAPTLLRRNDPHTRLLQAYLAVLMIGLGFTPTPISGITVIIGFAAMFGLSVYFSQVAHQGEAWYYLGVMNGILAGAGGPVLWAQQNAPIPLQHFASLPLTALFSICLAFHFTSRQGRRQVILMSLATINFCWVLLSGSRGNVLAAMCCLCFLVVELTGIWRRVVVVGCGAVLTLAICVHYGELADRAFGRVHKLFDGRHSAAARTSKRSDLVVGAWRLFLAYPLGVGTGGFAHRFSLLDDTKGLTYGVRGKPKAAHSLWMRALAENGVSGFALLVCYVYSFVLVGWSKRREGLLTIGILATAILSATFIYSDMLGHGQALFIAGVTVLLHRGNDPATSAV